MVELQLTQEQAYSLLQMVKSNIHSDDYIDRRNSTEHMRKRLKDKRAYYKRLQSKIAQAIVIDQSIS